MTSRGGLRIAIVGGGLGGTVCAILLQQAGYDTTVYEQAPKLERIGAGINLSSNATRVLRLTGLEPVFLARAFYPDQLAQRDWRTGEYTNSIRYSEFPARYGAPHMILHRGDLQEVLNTGLAPGSLRLGKRLVGLEDRREVMRLVFEDGVVADADIVIGADGINSRVREILLGPERPVYTGHVAHRAIFPAARLGGLRVADGTKWWAEDRYFMNYYLDPGYDELYIVTGVPQAWDSEDFSPLPTDLDEFKSAFEGFHPEVQHIIDACPSSVTWPVLYRDPYPLWSRQRIVLLGDACHPMKPHMGQGAAMAMEDAAMIARCIDHYHGKDPDAAFALYESLRYERTTRVKLESDKHEWMRYPQDGDWLWGYDVFAVPLMPPTTRV
jgi:6-hydroxynicotinate 3-monooxygenase